MPRIVDIEVGDKILPVDTFIYSLSLSIKHFTYEVFIKGILLGMLFKYVIAS
jgi:hypothetical protein